MRRTIESEVPAPDDLTDARYYFGGAAGRCWNHPGAGEGGSKTLALFSASGNGRITTRQRDGKGWFGVDVNQGLSAVSERLVERGSQGSRKGGDGRDGKHHYRPWTGDAASLL